MIGVCSLAIVLPDNLKHYVDKTTDRSPTEDGKQQQYKQQFATDYSRIMTVLTYVTSVYFCSV